MPVGTKFVKLTFRHGLDLRGRSNLGGLIFVQMLSILQKCILLKRRLYKEVE